MQTLIVTGATWNSHRPASPACESEKVASLTRIDAVRASMAVLRVTLYPTVPPPVPFAPAVTVIHEAELTAVHPHDAGDVTASVPVAASFEMLADVGAIVTVHAVETPSWLTGTA